MRKLPFNLTYSSPLTVEISQSPAYTSINVVGKAVLNVNFSGEVLEAAMESVDLALELMTILYTTDSTYILEPQPATDLLQSLI